MSRHLLLCNAFSLGMISLFDVATVQVEKISLSEAQDLMVDEGFISAVGHADTALLLSGLLGFYVSCNRITINATEGRLIVAQYKGPRLAEGTTVLPEGASFEFLFVSWSTPDSIESGIICAAEAMR